MSHVYIFGTPAQGCQCATCKQERLHAAAPDLLAALQLLVADVAQYEAWQRPCHALDVAHAALAKVAA